jgi:hypothetical protein
MMTRWELGPLVSDNLIGPHHKAIKPIAPVTREEYNELFRWCVRLTHRIEALEHPKPEE